MKARQLLLSQIPALKDSVHSRVVPAGETLFLEGETPRMLYQVVRGIAKLVSNSANGREVIVELVFPGEVIDLLGCMDGQPYQMSALALQQEELEVLAVPVELAWSQPQLVTQLNQNFQAKSRFQREMMVAMAVERVEQRAARALRMLGEYLGEATPAGLRLPLPLNRQEISSLIGSTLETAIRVLSSFRKQGLIQEQGGYLTLTGLLTDELIAA